MVAPKETKPPTAIWFTRTNGETAHNNPESLNYVPGEPPWLPNRAFDYREKCLRDGFVRVGWPNTGDLRAPGTGRLAAEGYAIESIDPGEQKRLRMFARIQTGALFLIPAGRGECEFHLGLVVRREKPGGAVVGLRPGVPAYYFFHGIVHGEWYECAHRVDVLWDFEDMGTPAVHRFPALGYLWGEMSCPVGQAPGTVLEAAKNVGFLCVP
jgi:hypothetical protein